MKYLSAIIATLSLFSASQVQAEYAVSIYGGKTMSQNLITTKQETVDIQDSNHYAISFDKHQNNTKYGLYYSSSSSELRDHHGELDLEYLLFQSAATVPLKENVYAYLGAQLGVNRISPKFSDSDSFFASGLYTGLDYKITNNLLIGTELRWLATIVKNTSKVSCGGDELSTSDNCIWHFDGDVLNQFQASVSLTFRF